MNNPDHKFKQKTKELNKLAVARLDIVEAQNACQYIIKKVKDQGGPMYYPHFVTLVICYARPFTNNNVYGALNNKWSKFPNDAANGMHKQLIDARNTFIAHSDGNVRSMQITPKGYIIPGTQRKIDYHTCQVKKFYIPLENFPLAKANCQYLVSQMNEEIEELLDYICPQLDFSKGPVEIDVTSFK